MTTVSVTQARQEFADMLNRVAYGGDRIAIGKHGKTIAVLVSPEDAEFLEALEDRLDVEAARVALAEPGQASWEKVKKDLGL